MSMQDIKMAGALEFWLSKKIISASFTFRWTFPTGPAIKRVVGQRWALCEQHVKCKARIAPRLPPDLPAASGRSWMIFARSISANFPMFSGIESWSKAPSTVSKARCGNPTCHCAKPDGGLHAAIVLSWSEAGRTRIRSLAVGDQARIRSLAENYRHFRQCRVALAKLHRQILAAMDRLEQALRLPPPPPASVSARRRK